MKIAVTYDNGNVFAHFGRTEHFKIYETEGGAVVSSTVLDANGVGHEALAGLLAEQGVDVLLCGGIGAGAQEALDEENITVCSGVSGNTDEAVAAYLRSELESAGVNCDHHHEEEEEQGCGGGCGGNCGGGCGSGCGGGCGGCGGAPQILLEGPNAGKVCRVHYTGTLDDGSKFDSSYDRDEPLEFICGIGMMIPGFDAAVVNMAVGEKRSIRLEPNEAYGEADPAAVFTFSLDVIPENEELHVGDMVLLADAYGRPTQARVSAMDDKTVTFDTNHELAGKALSFDIELLEVTEQ